MLSEEQIELMSDEIVPYFQQLEQEVVKDIVRRIHNSKRWTETAELEARALQKIGFAPKEIQRQVLDKIKADPEFIKTLTQNTLEHKRSIADIVKNLVEEAQKAGDDIVGSAGRMSFIDDMRVWSEHGQKNLSGSTLPRTIEFFQQQLRKDTKNFTGSTAFVLDGKTVEANKAFEYEMNTAMLKVSSGAFSPEQAVQDATRRLAEHGLYYVNFASGARRHIDTAMRLALRTTIGQMSGSIMMDNCNETGQDLVVVSSHAGARNVGTGAANHAAWQGKVYSVSGMPHPEEERRLGYRIEKLETATGYPSDPTGLCGYNCRHSFYVFWEGISEPNPLVKDSDPKKYNGKVYDYYHATQKQRDIERQIRDLKRQRACGIKDVEGKITHKQMEYKTFCRYMGLKPNPNRMRVYNSSDPLKSKAKKSTVSNTEHAQERARERAVSEEAISDAIQSPLYISEVKIDRYGRKSKKYIGRKATVVINPDTGARVTIWKTGKRTRKKYERKEEEKDV